VLFTTGGILKRWQMNTIGLVLHKTIIIVRVMLLCLSDADARFKLWAELGDSEHSCHRSKTASMSVKPDTIRRQQRVQI